MICIYIELAPGKAREIELLVGPETPRAEVLEAIASELNGEYLAGIGLIGQASVDAYSWLAAAFAAEVTVVGPSCMLAPLHAAPECGPRLLN
jgi:hypothetical protein